MAANDLDTQMRLAAFERVRLLSETHARLTPKELQPGFTFNGESIPLVNRPRGIFKPTQMRYLLSIKTVYPRSNRRIWYDDQKRAHQQIFDSEDAVDYAFMGKNPDAASNRWLREAYEAQVPIIYFLGVAPARYQAILPTFVSGWDASGLNARIAFGLPDQQQPAAPTAGERRYALGQVKRRLHQSLFREIVITAYGGRCALSGLPEHRLLDAAHIVPDRDEALGQPIVTNGFPLSKLHHAAYDAHLIGIDQDYGLHVSDRILDQRDGPTLEAIKQLDGKMLRLPPREEDRPSRDRLALRFEQYRSAA